MVEIFKTNIPDTISALRVKKLLVSQFAGMEVHFDLEDCDKILRLEGKNISAAEVIGLLNEAEFHCEVLED